MSKKTKSEGHEEAVGSRQEAKDLQEGIHIEDRADGGPHLSDEEQCHLDSVYDQMLKGESQLRTPMNAIILPPRGFQWVSFGKVPEIERLCKIADLAQEVERGLVALAELFNGMESEEPACMSNRLHNLPIIAHARGAAETWRAVCKPADEAIKLREEVE